VTLVLSVVVKSVSRTYEFSILTPGPWRLLFFSMSFVNDKVLLPFRCALGGGRRAGQRIGSATKIGICRVVLAWYSS
jgi:hypothetical protein